MTPKDREAIRARAKAVEQSHYRGKLGNACEGCQGRVLWPCPTLIEARDILALLATVDALEKQSQDGKCAVPNHPNWSPAQITTINYEETCQYADSLKAQVDAQEKEIERLKSLTSE
jgi:hypothetical protein